MKFRMVFLGQDEDPAGDLAAREVSAAMAVTGSPERCYEHKGTDMVRRDQLANGRVRYTLVANFRARIVRDIIRDDGAQQQRDFYVEAELGGRTLGFAMPAAEFGRMGWVLHQLGPEAIVYPGQQQHVRAAIQSLSGAIPQEQIFAHLGWREHGAQWVYLHAGGALGVSGSLEGLKVQLPAPMQNYRLRPPSDREECIRAVRASLHVLTAAPDRISFPLLAGVYRAALGAARFSLFLSGPSGVFKTALATLAQQHFGAAMNANGLPANFASTANALERLAFSAKDALLVVDDFAPTGGAGDGELQQVTERLFRAVGNLQGRGRLGPDGRLRMATPPRALVLGTGEQVPPGQSIRARLLIVEVGAGDVDVDALSQCQSSGQQGLLAGAMGAFVIWLAGHYQEVTERLGKRVLEIRSHSPGGAGHARTPSAVAELQSGMEIFLEFGVATGAIGLAEKEELERRSASALGELSARQAKYQECPDARLHVVRCHPDAAAYKNQHPRSDKIGAEPKALQDVWQSLRAFLLALGDDVRMVELDHYVAFRRRKNFACVKQLRTKDLLVWVRLDPSSVTLEKDFTRDVSQIGHAGTGDLEIRIQSTADLERAQPLLRRSYQGA